MKLLGKGRTQIRGWGKDRHHLYKEMGGVVKGLGSQSPSVTFTSTVNTVKQGRKYKLPRFKKQQKHDLNGWGHSAQAHN